MTSVYNRGTNPNQEGGIRLSDFILAASIAKRLKKSQFGRARTRSVARRAKRRKGIPKKRIEEVEELFASNRKRRRGARRTAMEKRSRLRDTLLDIVTNNGRNMQLVDAVGPPAKRRRRNVSTPPKPPPPARGRIIIDPNNNLNRVLKSLGLLTRKDGFEDARHKFTGWFLHGPNAGDPRPGRRSHLTRQAFILAQLAFNANNKNLPFSLTKLPKRRVKAQALVEALGPQVRRRGIRGNIQRGGVIGAAVPAGAIAAAKAGAVLAPILKAGGISLLSGAGSVLGAKLTNKLLRWSEEEEY